MGEVAISVLALLYRYSCSLTGGLAVKTDSLFYQLFLRFPGIFFELAGASSLTAAGYRFSSIEVKEIAFRLDGVFLPPVGASEQPIWLAEVQFQPDNLFYSRLFSEAFLFLRHHQPEHDWRAVVLFPSRRIEPDPPRWFREFFESDRLQRIYLDELPPGSSLGIEAVRLIITPPAQAPQVARSLMQRSLAEIPETQPQLDFVELISDIMIYKLPQASRQEIEAMLDVPTIKNSRVYQEAKLEAKLEGCLEDILDILETRFSASIPQPIADSLASISDLSALKALHRQAVSIDSLDAFQRLVDDAVASGDR